MNNYPIIWRWRKGVYRYGIVKTDSFRGYEQTVTKDKRFNMMAGEWINISRGTIIGDNCNSILRTSRGFGFIVGSGNGEFIKVMKSPLK